MLHLPAPQQQGVTDQAAVAAEAHLRQTDGDASSMQQAGGCESVPHLGLSHSGQQSLVSVHVTRLITVHSLTCWLHAVGVFLAWSTRINSSKQLLQKISLRSATSLLRLE
jgi:hypothetical protein